MRKLLFFFMLAVGLFAKTIEAEYKVSYGFFGKVGSAKAILKKNESNYTIEVSAKATGFAKFLSNGRKEFYKSEGVVEKGLLKPLLFQKIRSSNNKKDIKTYHFDYKAKKISVHIERYRQGKKISESDTLLPFFAKNDILTLYFNFIKFLKPGWQLYHFRAVGGERKTGRVDVALPSPKELAQIKKLMKEDGLYITVILHQKIFSSKEGKLYLVLDKDGITKKALLKDVILFGDIVGKLVKKEVRE